MAFRGRARRDAPSRSRPTDAPPAPPPTGTITALEPQRRRGGERVNVFVDGRFALSREASVAATLRVDQELDAPTLARLTTSDEQQRALGSAYTLLSYRPR